MRNLLLFKQIDCWGQVAVFFLTILWCIMFGKNIEDVMVIYYGVGGIQTISCIANLLITKKEIYDPGRFAYIKLLLALFGTAAVSFFDAGEFVIIVGLILLIISPFIAIWYAVISAKELATVRKMYENEIANS